MSIDSILDESFAQVDNSLVAKIQNPSFFRRIGRTIQVLTYVAVITTALNLAEKVNAAIHYVNPGQSIQTAINNAVNNDEIIVLPARYVENINFLGKAITVRGTEPENPDVVESTIIDGNQYGHAVTFNNGEDSNSILRGFTLTGGIENGGGISCESSSSPNIYNCFILGNRGRSGGAIYAYSDSHPVFSNCKISNNIGSVGGAARCLHDSSITFINCIISGNKSGAGGGALQVERGTLNLYNCTITGNVTGYSGSEAIEIYYQSNLTMENCILWGDIPQKIILKHSGNYVNVECSNIQGGYPGLGGIDVNPCFVLPGYWDPNGTPSDTNDDFWVQGDYHLKSEGWRWDENSNRWTWDDVTSRCIDAGNPGAHLGDEPLTLVADPLNRWGENLRIDMGAYSGTAEASMPPYGWALLADPTNDGVVNTLDLTINVMYWLVSGNNMPPDFNRDKVINMNDFGLLAEYWLKKTSWYEN